VFGIPLRDVVLVLAGALVGSWLSWVRVARKIEELTAAIFWLSKPR
jgi:ABC-type uncharacterized transport system permease subunit